MVVRTKQISQNSVCTEFYDVTYIDIQLPNTKAFTCQLGNDNNILLNCIYAVG